MKLRNFPFWRNAVLIGALHIIAIIALIRWSRNSEVPADHKVLWMSGGAASQVDDQGNAKPTATPMTLPPAAHDAETPPPALSTRSEIELPTATPSPTPRPTPAPTPRTTPSPKSPPPPKPTAKPSPKPTPKIQKKKPVSKATPKPVPTPDEEVDEPADEAPATTPADSPLPSASPTAGASTKRGTAAGSGTGRGASGSGTADFGWYASMLHDRFYSEWNQPTANVPPGAKLSAVVRLRIESDGRVTKFEVVRSSGNSAVDESISGMGKRVTQVDALPNGLGDGDHYEVNIKFELSSDR